MDLFRKNLKLYLLGFFIVINLFIWSEIFTENKNLLTVAFLDVGQGDAIFIEAPNGNQILIDGGQNRQVIRELNKMMPFYDRSIDVVILTHPDADHAGGLPAVLSDYQVDFVLEPGVSSNSGVYQEFENIIEEKEIKRILARQGMEINLYQGLTLVVLFPNQDTSEFEANTASVVLKLNYGESSFLFTGDSPKSIEKYLVEAFGDQLNVDVLKLGHHGSKTSNSDILLGFTDPDYAVASVGLGNRYNHPHKEVLDLIESFGIDLLRTDERGSVVFESDGVDLLVK